jgi:hypothetical protein
LAIGYLVQAAALPTSALADPVGASGFPMLIGWTMAGASVVLLLRTGVEALWSKRTAEADTDGSEIWATPLRTTARAAGVVAIAAVFLLILPFAGYLLSLFLLIGAVAIYQGRPPSWRIGLVAGSGAVFLWLLFVVVLNLPLPAGIWTDLL